MRTDINGIIAEIAKKIETEGRDAIFASFEYTDSIGLGIDGADVWVIRCRCFSLQIVEKVLY